MTKTFEYNGEILHVVLNQYSSNRCLAIEIHSEFEPYARISVNLEMASEALPRDCFYAKHWDGQKPIIDAMIKAGLIKETNLPIASSGFIDGIKAYQIVENICQACENWVDDNIVLTECKICHGKFCPICGDENSKICIWCDEDDFEEEDEEPSRDVGFTNEDREAFAIADIINSMEDDEDD